MNTPAERLRWARERAGFATAAEAARALGVSEPTYHGHENGTRGFKRSSAAKYAQRFHITLDFLLEGRGEPRPGYNETESALLNAFRKLPAHEADAYLELIKRRTNP